MPHNIPKKRLTQKSDEQLQLDTYGCGAQFSRKEGGYPQSKDIDEYLSSGQKQLDQPTSLAKAVDPSETSVRNRSGKEKQQYVPVSRKMGKYSYSSNGPSGVSQPDSLSMWQHAPDQEMPWNGVAAVGQGGYKGGSGKGGRSCNSRAFESATEGNSQGARSEGT